MDTVLEEAVGGAAGVGTNCAQVFSPQIGPEYVSKRVQTRFSIVMKELETPDSSRLCFARVHGNL